MRRRRYLQVTGAALATGLAGCNSIPGEGETPTATDTPTETATGTPTETPERALPVNVAKPSYMDLLPAKHMDGREHTPNAAFVRVDWQWYLEHYDVPMRFGATASEDWTLEANAGHLYQRPPPEYRLLHTPVGATIQTGKTVANILPEYPNLGPEIVKQCGFEMVTESGSTDSRAEYVGPDAAVVEEVLGYAKPGVTFFLGVDIESLRSALSDNTELDSEGFAGQFYKGVENAESRVFFVSDAWERPVLCVETADENPNSLQPPAGRISDTELVGSAFQLPSVRWCLSEFTSAVPVVVGQINGGRARFSDTTYNASPIRGLEESVYDSVFLGFDTNAGMSAIAQATISNFGEEVVGTERLRQLYGPSDGEVLVSRRSHVAELTASWGQN